VRAWLSQNLSSRIRPARVRRPPFPEAC
jgi:hypothetical protein